MPEVADLLDPVAQQTLREALRADGELAKYLEILEDETLSAVAVVGGHPAELQDLAASIIPAAARAQLDAYRLLDRHDSGDRVTWRLTERGRHLATAVAAAVDSPSDKARREAEEELQKLIDDGNADLESGFGEHWNEKSR